jgi:hypothetical protein
MVRTCSPRKARDADANVGTRRSPSPCRTRRFVSSGPHYIDLDGVDDFVSVPDAPALSFGNGTADTPFSIEMWMRTDQVARHQLIGKWGESTNQEYRLFIGGGRSTSSSAIMSAAATVTAFVNNITISSLLSSWHHLAVTYDGRGGSSAADGIAIYIDGVATTLVRINNPAYVAMENGTAPLEIGREGPSWRQFDGGLDDIRMWNVARTGPRSRARCSASCSAPSSGSWRTGNSTKA